MDADININKVTEIKTRLKSQTAPCDEVLKKRTEEIYKSEKLYRQLFQKSPVPKFIIDAATFKIVEVNDVATRKYKYSREELLGMTAFDLMPKADIKAFKQLDYSAATHPATYNGAEWRHLTKDGAVIQVSLISHEISYGDMPALIIVANDITEKKEAQELLKKNEELYRTLFTNMLHGFAYCKVIFKDGVFADYIYLVVNAEYELLTGLKNITGKKGSEVIPGIIESDARYISMMTTVLTTGKPVKFETYAAPLNMWFSSSVYSTEKDHFVSLIDNITERKFAEQSVQKINIELEKKVVSRTEQWRKSNEDLEAFSYSVSHDLRAPLRSIIGFANILEEEYGIKLDEEARRIIDIIKTNTVRMGNLIDDLLSFSRLGRQELLKTLVDMNSVAKDVINEMEMKAAGVQYKLQELPECYADKNTMRQVWINLISNAVKYSAKAVNPAIEIGAYEHNDTNVFYIKDNGAGFDEKYKDKLFKVFQRLHGCDDFEGTGIGLAIVEKIITRHGGKVWAESKPGHGATFFFSLPMHKANY